MTEKQQEIITQLLQYLEQAAKAAGEATQAELPLLLREILYKGLWDSVMFTLLGIIGLALARRLWQWATAADYDDSVPLYIAACLLGGSGLLFIANAVRAIGMVFFAPRVYLLEQIMEFLK